MKNRIWIYVAGVLPLILQSVSPAMAQNGETEKRTASSIERLKMESLWFTHTDNVAGVVIDRIPHYGELNFGYNGESGDYKHAQIGQEIRTFGFHTEGGGIYDDMKGMFFWGMFDYGNIRIKDAEYNASMYDPLRGVPFFLADQHKSDWHNMEYNMTAKMAIPVLRDRLVFGVQADYMAAQGAKQRDPRPRIEASKFTFTPSVVLLLNDRHSIGGNFSYFSRREEGDASTLVSMNSEIGYEYSAPGFFIEGSLDYFGSLVSYRKHNANSYGGGLQYSYKTDMWEILASGSYTASVEDIKSIASVSYALKMVGTVRDKTWNGKVTSLFRPADGHTLSVTLEYNDRTYEGIQYVQEYDNTQEVQRWITKQQSVRSEFNRKRLGANIDYMIGDNGGGTYKWKFGISAAQDDYSDVYFIPYSTQDVKNTIFGAYAKKNFRLGDNGNYLQLAINGGMSMNGESDRQYDGIMADHEVYKDFDLREFAYISSEYVYFGGALTFMNNSWIKGRSSLFATVEMNYRKASDFKELFDNRQSIGVKIGMTF